jgi:hypothetical protein
MFHVTFNWIIKLLFRRVSISTKMIKAVIFHMVRNVVENRLFQLGNLCIIRATYSTVDAILRFQNRLLDKTNAYKSKACAKLPLNEIE